MARSATGGGVPGQRRKQVGRGRSRALFASRNATKRHDLASFASRFRGRVHLKTKSATRSPAYINETKTPAAFCTTYKTNASGDEIKKKHDRGCCTGCGPAYLDQYTKLMHEAGSPFCCMLTPTDARTHPAHAGVFFFFFFFFRLEYSYSFFVATRANSRARREPRPRGRARACPGHGPGHAPVFRVRPRWSQSQEHRA